MPTKKHIYDPNHPRTQRRSLAGFTDDEKRERRNQSVVKHRARFNKPSGKPPRVDLTGLTKDERLKHKSEQKRANRASEKASQPANMSNNNNNQADADATADIIQEEFLTPEEDVKSDQKASQPTNMSKKKKKKKKNKNNNQAEADATAETIQDEFLTPEDDVITMDPTEALMTAYKEQAIVMKENQRLNKQREEDEAERLVFLAKLEAHKIKDDAARDKDSTARTEQSAAYAKAVGEHFTQKKEDREKKEVSLKSIARSVEKRREIALTLSNKKQAHPGFSEKTRRKRELQKAVQQPLAGSFPDQTISPKVAASSKGVDDDVGNPNYSPTSLKSDSTTPEEEEGPAPTTPTPGVMVQTPLKSSLKPDGMTTPDPLSFRQRLSSFLGGSSTKKKGRVSFTNNQIEEFETSPTERYVHTVVKHVPIWDKEKFEEWRTKIDPVFVKDFTSDAVKGMDPNIVCQTLHCAECKELLMAIPYTPLRDACKKAFPRYCRAFPKRHLGMIDQLRKVLKLSLDHEDNQGRIFAFRPETKDEKHQQHLLENKWEEEEKEEITE